MVVYVILALCVKGKSVIFELLLLCPSLLGVLQLEMKSCIALHTNWSCQQGTTFCVVANPTREHLKANGFCRYYKKTQCCLFKLQSQICLCLVFKDFVYFRSPHINSPLRLYFELCMKMAPKCTKILKLLSLKLADNEDVLGGFCFRPQETSPLKPTNSGGI